MNKYTVHFEVRGVTCELDFRADTSDYLTADAIGRALVAGIPGATLYHFTERVGRV